MVVSSKLSLKKAQHFLSFSENTCCLTDKPHTDTLACTQPSMRSGKVPGVEEMEFYAEPVIKAISRQGGQPSKHMPSTNKKQRVRVEIWTEEANPRCIGDNNNANRCTTDHRQVPRAGLVRMMYAIATNIHLSAMIIVTFALSSFKNKTFIHTYIIYKQTGRWSHKQNRLCPL